MDVLQEISSLNSKHAEAPLRYAEKKGIPLFAISNFEAITGKSVVGVCEGVEITLGYIKLMEEVKAVISPALEEEVKAE